MSLRGAMDSGTAPARERPVYAESLEAASFGCSPLNSVTEGSWKYIRAPRQELYDHKSDSLEQTNALEKEPAVGRRMRARLEGALHEMESAAVRRGTSGVDAEALRKLQGLGYMGAAAAATPSSAFDPAMEDPKDFQPTYERLQKANGLFLSKRTEEAKKELLAIIAARPTLVTAQALLAQIAIHERRLGDAAGYCQTIVAILAGSSAASKPADDGAEYVALGTLDTRNLATARCNLAVVWKEMGRIPEAIEQYELALRAAPGAAE
ncbi:MAG: hypothetical protein NT031_16095, partial [Planctomycetota bacterium]|nr:hypothetical protein [Planctomycetota bacterium]